MENIRKYMQIAHSMKGFAHSLHPNHRICLRDLRERLLRRAAKTFSAQAMAAMCQTLLMRGLTHSRG